MPLSGLPEGDTLPLLYPHTIGFPLHMTILTQPAFPLPIWRMLQVRNRIVQHAPLARDAELDITVGIAGHRILDKGAEFDMHAVVRKGGDVAWESLNTFYARGRFGAPTTPNQRGCPKRPKSVPATRRSGACRPAAAGTTAACRATTTRAPVERLCAQARLRARLLPSAARARPVPGAAAP
jgi:hypothetical protein